MWYHAECLGRDERELIQDEQNRKQFFCNWVRPFDLFVKKYAEIEEDLVFKELEIQFQNDMTKAVERHATNFPKRKPKHKIWFEKKSKKYKSKPINGLLLPSLPDYIITPTETNLIL